MMNSRSGQDKVTLSHSVWIDGEDMDRESETKLRSIAGDVDSSDHTVSCEATWDRLNPVLDIDEVFDEVSCLCVSIFIHEMQRHVPVLKEYASL